MLDGGERAGRPAAFDLDLAFRLQGAVPCKSNRGERRFSGLPGAMPKGLVIENSIPSEARSLGFCRRHDALGPHHSSNRDFPVPRRTL
jgi:hypothetical protein